MSPEPYPPLDPEPLSQPPMRAGRAGRNLPAAVAVGVGLAAVVLVTLYVEKRAFVGFAVVVVLLALSELTGALRVAGLRVPLAAVATGGVAMLLAAYVGGPEPLVGALALTAGAVLIARLAGGAAGYLADATAGIFGAVYVPFLASFAMLLLRAADGPSRIVVLVLLTACSDTGGYAVGVLLGRHPMAPTISPKKSWEGFAGSLLFGAVGGALAVPLLLGGGWPAGLLVGMAAVCSATLGDLGESLIKRDVGVKDMGTLLPGHGGVMDRLDSMLPTAPVIYLLLSWLVPPG